MKAISRFTGYDVPLPVHKTLPLMYFTIFPRSMLTSVHIIMIPSGTLVSRVSSAVKSCWVGSHLTITGLSNPPTIGFTSSWVLRREWVRQLITHRFSLSSTCCHRPCADMSPALLVPADEIVLPSEGVLFSC